MSVDPDRAEVLARLNARASFLKEFGIALGLCYALIAVWGLIQFQQVLQLWWTLALFFFAIIGPFVGMFVAPWAPVAVAVAVVSIGAVARSTLDGRLRIALYMIAIVGWFVAGTAAFSIYAGPR